MKIKVGLIVAAAAVSGCGWLGDNDKGTNNAALYKEDGKGCVQGLLLDGISGERLPVANSTDKEGVQVIVSNKVLLANTHVDGRNESANENLKGEYYVCGIPVDGTYPLLAKVEGYEAFESEITIPQSTAQLTPNSQEADREIEYPTRRANIYLYPLGTEANDLKFTILNDGEVVKNAKVQLQAVGSNIVQTRDNNRAMLAPQIRVTPQSVTTDDEGNAVFSGKELALGGQYQYTVIPEVSTKTLNIANGVVVVGYRSSTTALSALPFEVLVNLTEAVTELKVISQTRSSNPEGIVTLFFNQDVELVPNGDLSLNGTLIGAATAKLKTAANGRNVIRAKISGKRVELVPEWEVAPSENSDRSAALTISGLIVRPVNGNFTQETAVPAQTVRLFN